MENVTEVGKLSIRNKMARAIWNIVSAILFRPFGTKLFNPWRLFLLSLFGADVKRDSGVYASTKIWAPWNLKLGHNAWLGPDVICYNQAKVTLEDNVTVSQYSYLSSNPQPIGFRGNLLVKRPKFFYCTYSLGITETS